MLDDTHLKVTGRQLRLLCLAPYGPFYNLEPHYFPGDYQALRPTDTGTVVATEPVMPQIERRFFRSGCRD
jgi:hypothetical protein